MAPGSPERLLARAREWAGGVLGSAVTGVTTLAGGLDALTLRCALADGRSVTLRLLTDPEIAARQPVTTDRTMLDALAGHGLPIPTVLGIDVTGELAGCPALILSWIEGLPRADLRDPVAAGRQVVGVLEHVHALDPSRLGGIGRTTGERVLGEPWAGLAAEPLGGALWARMRRLMPAVGRPLVPIHADPWVGNLIWQGETLAGVIDWSDAKLGDPAADLGLVRLDVAIAAGPAAALEIQAAEHQRFWDLWGVTIWLANFDVWTPPLLALGSPLSAEGVRGRLRDWARFLLD